MALFEFGRLVEVLTRIADALDRAYPPRVPIKRKEIGPDAVSHISEEKLWERQTKQAATDEDKKQPPSSN